MISGDDWVMILIYENSSHKRSGPVSEVVQHRPVAEAVRARRFRPFSKNQGEFHTLFRIRNQRSGAKGRFSRREIPVWCLPRTSEIRRRKTFTQLPIEPQLQAECGNVLWLLRPRLDHLFTLWHPVGRRNLDQSSPRLALEPNTNVISVTHLSRRNKPSSKWRVLTFIFKDSISKRSISCVMSRP